MKSKGQVEDLITKEVIKLYVKNLGSGPEQARTYIVHDMVLIRLKGKLLPIEERLLEGKGGVALVKDIRQSLHEITVEGITSLIKDVTGATVGSSHSDISTKTGEILQVFTVNTDLENELKK